MTFLLRTVLLLVALWTPALSAWAQQTQDGGAPTIARTTPRPGDRIALRIWNEPEMSDTFNISEAGEVILPRLGSVYVIDQEVVALQDSLRRAYSVYLRNPSVEVVVLRRIGIQGEVREPGIYLADLTMALPDMIAMAGGITEAGNPNRIVVLRGTQRLHYGRKNQGEFLVAGLQSGDQVIVGQRSFLARNPVAALSIATTVVTVFLPMIRGLFDDDTQP